MHTSDPEVYKSVFDLYHDYIYECLKKNKKGKKITKDKISISLNPYDNKYFSLEYSGEPVARFALDQLQGCCGVCVSYFSYISFSYRGTGLGNVLCKMRIEIARAANYGLMICTDVDDNVPQKKIMESLNFQKATSFVNPKTNHLVNLRYINLTEK
jgi:hypothetical protein